MEWKWPTKESPQACRNAEGVWIACQTIQQSIALGREAYLIEGVTRLLQEVRKWMTDHLSPKRLTQSATKNPTASSCSGFGSTTVQNLSIVPLYHLLAKHGLLEHVDIRYILEQCVCGCADVTRVPVVFFICICTSLASCRCVHGCLSVCVHILCQ